jgi:GMP synthase (glutamine-hydrolysing)
MVLIIDCGYKYIYRLEDLVDQYIDFQTIAIFDFELNKIPEGVKGIILSNAQVSVHETNTDNYQDKIKAIFDLDLPILGIGFGHHLLGLCFDALTAYQPYTNDLAEIGIIGDSPIFDKLPQDVGLMEDHAGTISIPPNFELLASSDSSINEAMSHNTKPFYGVQFIPELSGNYGAIVIENFVNISVRYSS